jgi:hypothetical protein
VRLEKEAASIVDFAEEKKEMSGMFGRAGETPMLIGLRSDAFERAG